MRLNLDMPRRFLRGSSGRLALTVAALACGVGLTCAIDLVNRAVLAAFIEVVDTMAGRAALQVNAASAGMFPETVAETVAAVPGVELAVPVVDATAFVADGSGELVSVHGVDVTSESAVRVYQARDSGGLEIADPLAFLNQPDSLVVTRPFAERRRLGVDSELWLETPKGRRRFVVRGLIEPHGVARVYGGNLVVMDLPAAAAEFAAPGLVTRIDVVVARSASLPAVKQAIAASLPAGLHVQEPKQRKADLHSVMRSLHVLLQAVGLVALVAAFLIAFNRLSAVFEARAWQVGMLRAIGLRTGVVWRELVKEGMLLGLAGVAVGIPLGIGLGHLMLPVIATTTALNYKVVAPEAELSVRLPSLGLAALLGLGAAVTAALLPAWRAARVSLVATIRGRGTEQRQPDGGRLWVSRLLVAAVLLLALLLQSIFQTAAWGLLATALAAIATAMMSRPLLQAVGRPLIELAGARSGAVGHFAASAVSQNPRRASLTIAMLAVGLGVVLWLNVLGNSFRESVLQTMPGVLRGDLAVGSPYVTQGFVEAPLDEQLLTALRGLPGVAAVAGERAIDWHYAGGPIALNAFDPQYFTDAAFGEWPLVGAHRPDAWAAVGRGEAVVVSTNFVFHLGAGVGDSVTLDTPSGPLTLPIAGVTADFLSPRGTIEMSRDLYRRYWHDTQVIRALVEVADGTDVALVETRIAQTLGKQYELRIFTSAQLLDHFATQVRRAFISLDVLAAMALLVILLGLADTLAAGVVERTRDLSVLRAVGARRRDLRRIVIVEGMILGTLGLSLAIVAGLGLGALWVHATFPYLLGWVLDLRIPYGQLALVGLVTFGVCFIAALAPARRAAALQPAVALRYE